MKTMTARMDEDLVTLVEALAQAKGWRASDVVRTAVTKYVDAEADAIPELATKRAEILARRVNETHDGFVDTFGSGARKDLPTVRG
jgi:Arc/MetJ-type ribon-helix-helix transcriptional regulator